MHIWNLNTLAVSTVFSETQCYSLEVQFGDSSVGRVGTVHLQQGVECVVCFITQARGHRLINGGISGTRLHLFWRLLNTAQWYPFLERKWRHCSFTNALSDFLAPPTFSGKSEKEYWNSFRTWKHTQKRNSVQILHKAFATLEFRFFIYNKTYIIKQMFCRGSKFFLHFSFWRFYTLNRRFGLT